MHFEVLTRHAPIGERERGVHRPPHDLHLVAHREAKADARAPDHDQLEARFRHPTAWARGVALSAGARAGRPRAAFLATAMAGL